MNFPAMNRKPKGGGPSIHICMCTYVHERPNLWAMPIITLIPYALRVGVFSVRLCCSNFATHVIALC